MEEVTCKRCGILFAIAISTRQQREVRQDARAIWCDDCRGFKSVGQCKPHTGEVNWDTMQPLDKHGELFRPGLRLCGREDCVNVEHIIQPSTLEQVRPSKWQGTDKQVLKRLLAEQPDPCVVKDCGKPEKALGLCATHYTQDYRRRKRDNAPKKVRLPELTELMGLQVDTNECLLPSCDLPVHSKNLCSKHYTTAWRRTRKANANV